MANSNRFAQAIAAGYDTDANLRASTTFAVATGEIALSSDSSALYIARSLSGGDFMPVAALLPLAQKTDDYTATSTDVIIEYTANTKTLTLPTAVGIKGRVYTVKNSGSGVVTVDANSTETIDGNLTITLNQYDGITIVSNNSNWIVISRT